MAITIRQNDRYFIKGKIVETASDGTLVIFVAHPFSCEIKFTCFPIQYNSIHSSRLSKYDWLGLHGGPHPFGWGIAAAYYNTEKKCFYKKEAGNASDGDPEWEVTDFKDIYHDNSSLRTNELHSQQKEHKFFVDRYIPILQKGMLCKFDAYALDTNGNSAKNKDVEDRPHIYDWIYDPDSFRIEEWNAESIESLVKEILPSRECVEELLKRHDAADDELKKEKWKKRGEWIKSIPKRLQNWLAEYDTLMIAVITFASGAAGLKIIEKIISIIRSFLN